MSFVVILIIALGVGVGALAVVLVRMIVTPKRLTAVQSLIRQGRLAPAARMVRGIISKTPSNSAAHYLLGHIYLAENKPELALMEFKSVNQIGQFGENLSEVEFRKHIAVLYERFSQFEEALREHILLSKLEPSAAEHYYDCGRLFDDRGKLDTRGEIPSQGPGAEPAARKGACPSRPGALQDKASHGVPRGAGVRHQTGAGIL